MLKKIDIKPEAALVNELAVQLLEEMLADAKEGKVQEVVVCGILSDGGVASAYTPTMNFLTRLGTIEHVKMRWLLNDVGPGESV